MRVASAPVCADLRKIYTAVSVTDAERALAASEAAWSKRFPMVAPAWRNRWADPLPGLPGGGQLRSKDSPSPAPLQVEAQPPSAPAPEDYCAAITREAVESSTLRSIGYCDSGQILELEFTRGTVYRYYGVPAEIHRAFMRAPSKSRYLNGVFKPLGYRYERLR